VSGRFFSGTGAAATAAFRERTLRLVRDIAETQGFTVPRFSTRAETGVLLLQRAQRPLRAPGSGYAGHFVYHFAAEGATLSFFASDERAEAAPPRASFAYFYLTDSDWLHSVEPMYALLGDLARAGSRRLSER
jgi:hypothetical protein